MLNNIKEELGIKTRAPGIFHRFIAEKLKEIRENEHTNMIKRKDAIYIITRHMSSDCVQKFLDEMEQHSLIKQKDKQNIEILN